MFLPNLVWNYQHHFPFLELQANIRRSGRNVELTPLSFFAQEILSMHPMTLPIWLAGLWFYLFSKTGKSFRAIGLAWLFTAGVILVLDPRVYYLYPAYPILFAAGGVTWESWLARPQLKWIKFGYPILMVLSGALIAPFAIPVLPVKTYIRYSKALHFQQPAIENRKTGPLTSDLRRPVRMGGDGGHSSARLQWPVCRYPREDGDPRAELRPGWGD
jgi:hypothetical protein